MKKKRKKLKVNILSEFSHQGFRGQDEKRNTNVYVCNTHVFDCVKLRYLEWNSTRIHSSSCVGVSVGQLSIHLG